MDRIIVEIRAGDGGNDAKLFVHDNMVPMYCKYCKQENLTIGVIEEDPSTAVLEISGENAAYLFRLEPGTHRLQRVPPTEKKGRRQSSTVFVNVLPIVNNATIDIKKSDVEYQRFKSSGPGGQHRNTTETAIRAVHLPTGITAVSAHKSQYRNKTLALEVLKSRIARLEKNAAAAKINDIRRAQLYTTLAKVRTYNFIEDRCTDVRLKKKCRNSDIMKGKLDKIYDNAN